MNTTIKHYGETSERGVVNILRGVIKGFGEGRFLAKQLFIRDIRSLYRQSILGIGWAFIVPLFIAGVWIYLNSAGLVKVDESGVPYPLFVLSGVVLWQTFLEALTAPMMTFNASKPLLTKINFPKEALILSGFYRVLFNLGVKLSVIVPLYFYYSHVPGWWVVMTPIFIIAMILVAFSVGIILTPVAVLYNDVERLIQAGSQLVFLLSPIIYPFSQTGIKSIIDRVNPVAVYINAARDCMVGTQTAGVFPAFWIHAAIFGVILVIGLVIYKVSIPIIVERMGT